MLQQPMIREVIEGPANWRGPDIVDSPDWVHQFSPAEIAEVESALQSALTRGMTFDTLTRETFPLPTVAPLLSHAREIVLSGLGLFLFRGIRTEHYPKDALRLLYWGIGKHLGTAVSQSRDGDLLADVRDIGSDINSPSGRGHRSNQELSFHCDSCDLVGLFSLRVAKTGGLSLIASSLAIRNAMAGTRPDLLEILYQPFYWSWLQQEAPGEPPYYPQPIFSEAEGHFSCRLVTNHIVNAQTFPEVPRLTEAQREALATIGRVAASEDFHLSMMFQPGDLQLLNNHLMLHARTAFTDYPEPDRRRHLLRLWLSAPGTQPLSPALCAVYRDGQPGAVRGGFPTRTGGYRYETLVPVMD